ncbi:MAG: phosphotransferase [Candidatus Cloacimonetes bacterium]|nr:phosphotransferase [Candidatus Cloacimonadota bacterium]
MRLILTPKNKLEVNEENQTITKIFTRSEDFIKELYIYQHNPLFAPRFIKADKMNHTITLQQIVGKTIFNIQPDFQQVAQLFLQLHQFEDKTLCMMDTNPNNIIFQQKENQYYLIDFSDWQYEHKEFDLIHFMLFWASIYNEKTFEQAARNFLDEYDKILKISRDIWKEKVLEIIDIFDERRRRFNRRINLPEADIEENRKFLLNFWHLVEN